MTWFREGLYWLSCFKQRHALSSDDNKTLLLFLEKNNSRISLYGLCILLRPQVWRHLVQVTPWVETQTPGIWGHDRETFTMYVSFCHSAQWCKEVGPCIVFFKNQFLSNPAFCPIWHKPKTWKLKNLKTKKPENPKPKTSLKDADRHCNYLKGNSVKKQILWCQI